MTQSAADAAPRCDRPPCDRPPVARVLVKSGKTVMIDGLVCQRHLRMEQRLSTVGMAKVEVLPLPYPVPTADAAPAERNAACVTCGDALHEYPFGWQHVNIPHGPRHDPAPRGHGGAVRRPG